MTIPSYEYTTKSKMFSKPPVLCADSIAGLIRAQKWGFEPHSHKEAHQFFWINKGTGRVHIDGSTRGFGPNTVIFIPAGTVHGFEFSQGAAGWVATLSTNAPIPFNLPKETTQFALNMREDQSALTALCDEINREQLTDAPGKEQAMICHAGLLSVWLIRQMAKAATVETSATSGKRLMHKFVHLLENQFDNVHSVASYAENLEVTPTHLTRVCRQSSGKSATGLIQDRALLEARRRLALTDQKISRIAKDLGFASAAYFTRLFTQKSGHSPSEFRKLSRQISLQPSLGS